MSKVHLARSGFITKAALPSITRQRGTTTVSSNLMLFGAGKTTVANNTTFIDSSANAFTITRSGDTVHSGHNPFSTVSDGSAYFDGTGDYLTAPANAAFTFGTGDFTIECWFYSANLTDNGLLQISTDPTGFSTSPSNTTKVAVVSSKISIVVSGNVYINQGPTISSNTWTHVALVRSSGISKVYVNGSLVTGYGTAGAITDTTNYTGTYSVFGGYNSTAFLWNGYISNVRIVKGTAVYTSNFTPSTSALTAITNTQLLLLTDNYSIVNSTPTPLPVTIVGNTTISTAQFPTGMNRSIFFDGSGDSLSVSANASFNFGTSDWTIEAYVYIAANSPLDGLNRRYALICEITNNGGFYINGNSTSTGTGLSIYNAATGANVSVTGTISQNVWNHLAVSRVGGTAYFFANGTLVGTSQAISGNWGSSSQPLVVAQSGTGSFSFPLNGYMSNLRITKGTGIYTSSFTPSAPLSINTSIPANVTNAIYGVNQLA